MKKQRRGLDRLNVLMMDGDPWSVKPKCEAKWNVLFNQNFNCKSIMESIYGILGSNKEKQFQWKMMHNAIFTEH